MQLRGVKLGQYHSSRDWSLIMSKSVISSPKVKTIKVSVDGRDGDHDLTEALTGFVNYENRTASFSFLLTEGTRQDRDDLLVEILAEVHGNRLNVVHDDDPTRYLVGRCVVTNYENKATYGQVDIEVDCEPWRYAIDETIVTFELNSSETQTVRKQLTNNGKKPLVPDITVTGNIVLKFDNNSVSMSDGSYKITELILTRGVKDIELVGTNGTITFTYREAVI